ncbi:ferredoxin hydrogenase large subunit [Desulfitispora alkaliphila]|uniref:4Fe-4S dicluster domain-containing protein n=1 Tax=Desulfitispora alkaliphila TaxID=622674 RepID=UPI003D1CCAEF
MANKKNVSEKFKLRKRVMEEVAKLALKNELAQKIDDLPDRLLETQGDTKYRCCEYKEKAIYAERIKSALGLNPQTQYRKQRLSSLLEMSFQEPDVNHNQVSVMDIACEGCPINKFFITNACQNCLDHSCQRACPKDAISVVQSQAYIDQTLCVECGICKKACHYSAVVEINRPCEAACLVGAITATNDRKAEINNDKCIECGACISGCPFAAITERSQIVKVIELLRDEKVVAMIAPAFIGQFGHKTEAEQVIQALKKLGFAEVYEVALGADMVSLEELEEFKAKVPSEQEFMTTSCCPAFVGMIDKHFPDLSKNISSTISPMVALAKHLKRDSDTKTVFIGPCIAKKSEARDSGVVDSVLTFEELAALFEAADIDLSQLTEDGVEIKANASQAARAFAKAGGVTRSIEKLLTEEEKSVFNPDSAQGLEECMAKLKEMSSGKSQANFFEGMVCTGGCIGGPGTIVNHKMAQRFLEKLSQSSDKRDAAENELAGKIKEDIKEEMHR